LQDFLIEGGVKTFLFVAYHWTTADQQFYVHPLNDTSENLDLINDELRLYLTGTSTFLTSLLGIDILKKFVFVYTGTVYFPTQTVHKTL